MQPRAQSIARVAGTVLPFLFCMAAVVVWADVTPGEVIDSSTYQKIEGLVPDYILLWVKNGEMTMRIGQLTYDPKEYFPKQTRENWKANIGRFKIDENNGIVDAVTGKPVRSGIKGLAFPEPDPNDPKVGVMLMWNNLFHEYFEQGNNKSLYYWLSISRSGLEKVYAVENLVYIPDPSKSEYDYAQVNVFRQPFNMSGIGTLAMYPLYPKNQGVRFAYTPELRRMKRLSSRLAGSDTHFGFDAADPDDSWAGGPKTNVDEGIYTFLGEREALVPHFQESPVKVEYNQKGEIELSPATTGIECKMGYQTPGWKGAPWHVTNLVWVKTRVYVVESRSTDPNYAYGPCEGWIDKTSFAHCYKRITDPGGKLWKGFYHPVFAFETPDGSYRLTDFTGKVVVDMKRDHGSAYPEFFWKGGYKKILVKEMNEKIFTPDGFLKYAK
jgi:hypothetical protein